MPGRASIACGNPAGSICVESGIRFAYLPWRAMARWGFNRLLFWKSEEPKQAPPPKGGGGRLRAAASGLWNDHRWATIGVAALIATVVIAAVGYTVLKRPGDKSCPAPCTITSEAPQPVSGTTNW